jgi:hypothetical protein
VKDLKKPGILNLQHTSGKASIYVWGDYFGGFGLGDFVPAISLRLPVTSFKDRTFV